MKLTYFRGKVPNFGDELNAMIWPALLPPGFLDDDESELFVGIGSIIGTQLPPAARKVVMGSGFANYMGVPDMHDGTWDIRFVRGPVTVERLGLDPGLAIADSAVLLRVLDLPEPAAGVGVAFMPHYESLERGRWAEACHLAGIRLIDPREPVETVIAQIRGARLLVTEAMHGAIVADALRTPWIAARPIFWGHHMKWEDWSRALAIDLRFNALRATNLLELYVLLTGRGSGRGRLGAISRSPVAKIPNDALTQLAARHLQRLANREPQLSSDSKIAEVTGRAMAEVDRLVASRARAA